MEEVLADGQVGPDIAKILEERVEVDGDEVNRRKDTPLSEPQDYLIPVLLKRRDQQDGIEMIGRLIVIMNKQGC